jgi:hypothetical protein
MGKGPRHLIQIPLSIQYLTFWTNDNTLKTAERGVHLHQLLKVGQKDHKFKVSLGNLARGCLKIK